MCRSGRPVLLVLLAVGTVVVSSAHGPSDARGEVGLALMLRKLATTGTVFHATAHPDDEHNGLLAMQSHGQGLRVVLASATRGNGGQNEIGPELFEALGVLRTEELAAAHRFDGAEQLFTRAADFGFSFSVEETFERWGREAILDDFVRLIRMTRPHVIVTMRPDGTGGGQHHQASARIATDAFRAAGDPARFPGHLADGLRAWQAHKIYQAGYYGFPREPRPADSEHLLPVDAGAYDPLLGRTYAEIGSEARAMHKCQGFGQLLALPGSFTVRYRLVDTTLPGGTPRAERTMHDGLDLSIESLARFSGGESPERLARGLRDIAAAVDAADRTLRASGPIEAVAPLARGLTHTRAVLDWLATGPAALAGDAADEVTFRLRQTERKFAEALVLAQGLRLEALADDGVVVPGQPVKVTLILANRGERQVDVGSMSVAGFGASEQACPADGPAAAGDVVRCELAVSVPDDAPITAPYWHRAGDAGRYTFDDDAPFGLPFRPTPFLARFSLEWSGVPVTVELPVVHRYEGNIFSGEKRMELHVVPAIALRVSPEIAIVPVGAGVQETSGVAAGERAGRAIAVTVTNNAPGPIEAAVGLRAPDSWRVEPASQAVRFSRADEAATVTFRLEPPARAAAGEHVVVAEARAGGRTFDRSVQVIEYPHTRRRHVIERAVTRLKVIDARLPDGVTVGYVMGVGDQVPPALEQLGARVVFLDEAALAAGDLSRFDAIVTGVRAYERRRDLRTYNHRLIAYAEGGGTVLVQYNKFEFNQAQYGPFPAKVSGTRVTDEGSNVRLLEPAHPAFTWPNQLTETTWEGWVQERGLYFLGERDARYRDLVELEEPFEYNRGWKRGGLVEAQIGRGRWVYVGLGLWRQLPAGTDGAYALIANLVSLGRQGGHGPGR